MKVYIVEEYDWDSASILGVYSTRDAAEAYIADAWQRAFAKEGRKAERRPTAFVWSKSHRNVFVERMPDGSVRESPDFQKGKPTEWTDIPAETFEEFKRRWGWSVEVHEHDVIES